MYPELFGTGYEDVPLSGITGKKDKGKQNVPEARQRRVKQAGSEFKYDRTFSNGYSDSAPKGQAEK